MLFWVILTSVIVSLLSLMSIVKSCNHKGSKEEQVAIANIIRGSLKNYISGSSVMMFNTFLLICFPLLSAGIITTAMFAFGGLLSISVSILTMYVGSYINLNTARDLEISTQSTYYKSLRSTSCYSIFLHSTLLAILSTIHYFSLFSALLPVQFGFLIGSLILKLTGGIFTKGADIGADLVGKLDLGLEEDSPKNPASIADAVGDFVGDASTSTLGIMEVVILLASFTMKLVEDESLILHTASSLFFVMPLGSMILGGISQFFLSAKNSVLRNSVIYAISTIVGSLGIFGILCYKGYVSFIALVYFFIGIIMTIITLVTSYYYTSSSFSPIQDTIEASKNGPATNIITGMSYSYSAVGSIFFLISVMLYGVYYLIENMQFGTWHSIGYIMWGVITMAPTILAFDYLGPIFDTAGSIITMSKSEYREKADKLDVIGNSIKAMTKSYIFIGTLLSFATITLIFQTFNINLYSTIYTLRSGWFADSGIKISTGITLCGLLAGISLISMFIGLTLRSVNVSSNVVMKEIKLQIEENPETPSYSHVIEKLTTASVNRTIIVLSTFIPIIIVLYLGRTDSAFLIPFYKPFINGVIGSSLISSMFMIVAGGLWDNAKKTIGLTGNKDSKKYKSSVIGDTVGDPFKDTVGPALFTFAKVAIMVISISFSVINSINSGR